MDRMGVSVRIIADRNPEHKNSPGKMPELKKIYFSFRAFRFGSGISTDVRAWYAA